jgi:hypothetical protein
MALTCRPDLSEATCYPLEEPFDLLGKLRIWTGCNKPQSGYDGSTTTEWGTTVHVWGAYVAGHPQQTVYVLTTSSMLKTRTLESTPNTDDFNIKARR